MSSKRTYSTQLVGSPEEHNGKSTVTTTEERQCPAHLISNEDGDGEVEEATIEETKAIERKLVRKIDLRLCTIAGILCSLNLLDSGIISSASVTSIFGDLGLGVGNRYVS